MAKLEFGENGPTIDLSQKVDDIVAAVEATGDPEVAAAAAEVEGTAQRPRKTLLAALAALAAGTAAEQASDAPTSGNTEFDEPENPDASGLPEGHPTEPDRGGMIHVEKAAFGDQGDEPAAQPANPTGPSITGSYDPKHGIGVPTEPDRGGLNPQERQLHGAA